MGWGSKRSTKCACSSTPASSRLFMPSRPHLMSMGCSIPAKPCRRCNAVPSLAPCACIVDRRTFRNFHVSEIRPLKLTQPLQPGRVSTQDAENQFMQDAVQKFSETIRKAGAEHTQLRIRGSGSKDFYGLALIGDVLDTRTLTGIVDYEPTELVMTARAGTTLREVEKVLADASQMLAFEPPHFGPEATLGGCIASGFSGPRRAAAGSARDFVLGVRMVNGIGEVLHFGGQVMKNVAGYDLSRLMTGSFGTLGVITEVSLKVLPRPEQELTLRFELDEATAIATMNAWAAKPLPLSASCHQDGVLHVRLAGAAVAVDAARKKLGGEIVEDGAQF